MGEIYITADTHFGHEAIIRYENRPFQSVEEMNESILKNWNDRVGAEDTIFHLGDFSFYEMDKNRELVKQLSGYKILILGNHDRHYTVKQWLEMGFDEVYAYPILFREWFILSHEPVYINVNMPYVNIFGHVHGNPMYKDVSMFSFPASLERTAYCPIALEEIKKNIQDIK